MWMIDCRILTTKNKNNLPLFPSVCDQQQMSWSPFISQSFSEFNSITNSISYNCHSAPDSNYYFYSEFVTDLMIVDVASLKDPELYRMCLKPVQCYSVQIITFINNVIWTGICHRFHHKLLLNSYQTTLS